MIIRCPNCGKQFKIDPNKIPQKGRNLQCGSCDHIWFFKIEDKQSSTPALKEVEKNEDLQVKIKQSPNNNIEEKEKETKKNLGKPKSLTKKNKQNTDSKFFSNLIVFIVSFVALIILIDTLKTPLINIFPGLEIILFNLFETLKDIKLFIMDLT